jgi:hypothetical protein
MKSEPRVATADSQSERSTGDKLWLLYQTASKDFRRQNYDESFAWLEKGLHELGQSVPRTRFQLIFGLTWQLARLSLNKIYIGRMLSRLNIWRNGETRTLRVYKLCALFYYEASKFAYLNPASARDFTPKATIDEHFVRVTSAKSKPGQNSSTNREVNTSASSSLRVSITPYSYLMSVYFMLATYNMSSVYSQTAYAHAMTDRDEYNLCEFYMSMCLYLSLFTPSKLSRALVKYLLKKKLARKLRSGSSDEPAEAINNIKLVKMRQLLKKNLFVNYVINFDNYSTLSNNSNSSCSDDESSNSDFVMNRQNVLNIISFKRRLFKTESFLYNSDDSAEHFELSLTQRRTVDSEQGRFGDAIASAFILGKFKDFVLYKMTAHIVTHSNMISTERILAQQHVSSPLAHLSNNKQPHSNELDEEQREQADIDQIKFDKLKALYGSNLEYFSGACSVQERETHAVLVEFLSMLNSWKLRNFELIARRGKPAPARSLFIEAINHVLDAYEVVRDEPDRALRLCRSAIESLKAFNSGVSQYSSNFYLIEVT